MPAGRTIRFVVSLVLACTAWASFGGAAWATTVCPCPKDIAAAPGDDVYVLTDWGLYSNAFGDGNSHGAGDRVASTTDGRYALAGTQSVSRYTSTGALDTSFGGGDGIAPLEFPSTCTGSRSVTDLEIGEDGSVWMVVSALAWRSGVSKPRGTRLIRIDPTGTATAIILDGACDAADRIEVAPGSSGSWFVSQGTGLHQYDASGRIVASRALAAEVRVIGAQPDGDVVVAEDAGAGVRLAEYLPGLASSRAWGATTTDKLHPLRDGSVLLEWRRDGGSYTERWNADGSPNSSHGFSGGVVTCGSIVRVAPHGSFLSVLVSGRAKDTVSQLSLLPHTNPQSPDLALARADINDSTRWSAAASTTSRRVIGRAEGVEFDAMGCGGPGIERVELRWKGATYTSRFVRAGELTPGAGTLELRAVDRLGVEVQKRYRALVDYVPPSVVIGGARERSLTFTVRDTGAGPQVHAPTMIPRRGCWRRELVFEDRAGNQLRIGVVARSGKLVRVQRRPFTPKVAREQPWRSCSAS